ncbi:hypothetical protein [Stutzerimonas nitrititolerans]|uniref:hypothetical protein n=1 Tax=Stutzerimonas nitrititolerans TaxID=2482751 RepID=UPI0028AD20C8|nr:hypothetical protein [Stutzerimonas nitrititolerans]
MPIFKLTARETGRAAVVRARCITCARTVAADNAGAEGTMLWRDPAQSKIELIRPDDKSGLILKAE